MKLFALLSEEYEYKEIELGYPEFSGPTYLGRDVLFIAAETRSKAKYFYHKKHCNHTDVRDYFKVKIRSLGNCNYPEGIVNYDSAEKDGFEFPSF